jgi:hypothetical protein
MSQIPAPGAKDRKPRLLNAEGLEPLHLEPPSGSKGLRPLGQVDGLEKLAPTTAIFPTDDAPLKQMGDQRKRLLATSLDWDRSQQDKQG